jgi:hypothetical protein
MAFGLPRNTIYKRTPFSDFSIFAPFHIFFDILFTKLESTTLILTMGPYFGQSLNGKGGFDFRRSHTKKNLEAKFFNYVGLPEGLGATLNPNNP